MTINDGTPIVMLTLGQLKEVGLVESHREKPVQMAYLDKEFAFGLKDIREELVCIHFFIILLLG